MVEGYSRSGMAAACKVVISCGGNTSTIMQNYVEQPVPEPRSFTICTIHRAKSAAYTALNNPSTKKWLDES